MKIAILGAGAMGLLYGGYLSRDNDVFLLCTNENKANIINENGVIIKEKDEIEEVFHPTAVVDTKTNKELRDLDVVILFVKARDSQSALEENKHLFGKKTTLLTLQNGAGHEDLLKRYVTEDHLAIGISQEGSLLLAPNKVQHTGSGFTYFGKPLGDTETLAALEATCNKCGFQALKSKDIKVFIWEKLMINASSSVLSGVLGKRQGYCYTDQATWRMVQRLVAEMVEVANEDGIPLDYNKQIQRLGKHLTDNPEGVPSICIDLREGNLTEVDTISGSVVAAGQRLSVATPTHQVIVALVHAMEGRKHDTISDF